MTIKISERYMKESLREFIEELLPDAGIVAPKVFIIMVADEGNITYCSSSNSSKRTLDTLKRAVELEVSQEVKDAQENES